ncbi:MAG: hypothetical protein WKG07_15140 [Hymenobacter sp.]
MDWGRKAKYAGRGRVLPPVAGAAARRTRPSACPRQELIARHLEFLPGLPPGTIGYQLKDHAGGDAWQTITVLVQRPAPAGYPASCRPAAGQGGAARAGNQAKWAGNAERRRGRRGRAGLARRWCWCSEAD